MIGSWWRDILHGHSIGLVGKFRIHPLSIALILVACGVGLWKEITVLFLLVMLHELGHAAAAHALGYEVDSVSLLPFGGVARMSYGNIGFTPRHEAMIAVAGPLVNLVLIAFSVGLSSCGVWSNQFGSEVIRLNAWIAIFNLLPAMPLDGGRVLRAARSRHKGFQAATQEAYTMGIVFATVLLALGVISLWAGYAHYGILILGVFLFVSAWVGRRDLRLETMRFLDAKKRAHGRRIDEVRSFAVTADAKVRDIVTSFGPDRYHLVYILGKDGEIQRVIGEEDILLAVFDGLWLTPVGEL